MTILLLLIIYLAFISLGLPDSLLGAAWPVMQKDFGVPLETAGILFMTIAGGTIVSSFVSGKVIKRFGTGKVTFFSGLMTSSALLGMYFSPSIIWMGVWSILLGFGAGAVDTALNNYVANHYKAHHMSWLHSFWGVGATLGPVIIAGFILEEGAWRTGYLTIAVIQFILTAILLISLPLWNKVSKNNEIRLPENTESSHDEHSHGHTTPVKPLQIKGVKLSMLTFLFYCGVETAVGLWGSSFLVNVKELPAAVAAQWVSFYWGGLTIGRFLTGFVTFKMSNTMLIRSGQTIALVGAALLLLPLPTTVSLVGFIMIGFGLAPIYPCMLHETPSRFGKTNSQTIMGYQMGVAYIGGTFIPPILGLIASHTTIGIFPFFIVIFIIGMLLSSERLIALLRMRAHGTN